MASDVWNFQAVSPGHVTGQSLGLMDVGHRYEPLQSTDFVDRTSIANDTNCPQRPRSPYRVAA